MERTTRLSIVAAALLWLASSGLPVVTYACDGAEVQVMAVVNDDTPAPAPPARTPRPPHTPRSAAGSTPSSAPEATPAPPDAAPSPEVPEAPEAPEAPRAAFEFPAPPATITPRGWFGFAFEGARYAARPATPDSAAVWRFYNQLHVSMVEDGSPAARAGLRRGDIIIALDGTPIVTAEAGRRFGSVKPGQVVRWTVLRDGEKRQLVVTAGERPGRVRVQIIDLQRQLSRMSEQTDNEEMRRSLEEFKREMERLRDYQDWRPSGEPGPHVMQRLRYAGVIGASEIEVRGPDPVIVNSDGDEMVISVGNSVVKIRTGEAARKRTGSAAARKPDSPK